MDENEHPLSVSRLSRLLGLVTDHNSEDFIGLWRDSLPLRRRARSTVRGSSSTTDLQRCDTP